MAQYLSFNFDPTSASHFQLNGFRGCYPHAADRSFALNPKQVNFIVPSISVSPDGMRAGAKLRGGPDGLRRQLRIGLRLDHELDRRARTPASARSGPGQPCSVPAG